MKFLVATLFWLVALSAFAAADPGQVAVPPLTARVTDLTGTITPQQQASLEQELHDFEQAKGSQIAVLIIPTTGNQSIEQYSIRVVDQWKLGRAKVDDGALLIVAKTTVRCALKSAMAWKACCLTPSANASSARSSRQNSRVATSMAVCTRASNR